MYNDFKLKKIRKRLRKNQTNVERIIWSKLRNQQLNGFKFFRQYSVGRYVLDFYCPKVRLAIEIDGGWHNKSDVRARDHERTDFLKLHNIKVIRFWNNEVINNSAGVCKKN